MAKVLKKFNFIQESDLIWDPVASVVCFVIGFLDNGEWVIGYECWGNGSEAITITNYQLPLTNYQLLITN
ncbi:hypothetical protein LYNGBM3L_38220 [Moorena producens 3L]|uniref:Uncharacterized protein n=1 Tax=Moorena producens 3L TaxID=489825 RepID=F4XV15_9CYAN|nr:hypothetical protein LYNGBM3L_38220 [Moorena producens 3L]OLT66113.1 hypothetical protein BI334_14765 [Moorena producens 3L]